MPRYRRHAPVSPADIVALLSACENDRTLFGRRDAALIYLFAVHGVPKSNLCRIGLEDYRQGSLYLPAWRAAIDLPPQGKYLVDQWLAGRGAAPGPLFLPIARPSMAMPRPMSPAVIASALARRCRAAKIRPFSPDDVARTHSFVLCRQWRNDCCSPFPPGAVLVPGFAERPGSYGADGRDAALEGSATVLGYLDKLIPAQRRVTLERLNQFAGCVTPGADAFSLPWLAITPGALEDAVRAAARSVPSRSLNLIKRAVTAVLRHAVLSGWLSEERYGSLQRVRWRPRPDRAQQSSIR